MPTGGAEVLDDASVEGADVSCSPAMGSTDAEVEVEVDPEMQASPWYPCLLRSKRHAVSRWVALI